MPMTDAAGQQGTVKCGAVKAATLRDWQMVARDGEPHTWTLTATAVDVNRFYLSQSALLVSLRVGSKSWRWRNVTLELAGGKVRGTLSGQPEKP